MKERVSLRGLHRLFVPAIHCLGHPSSFKHALCTVKPQIEKNNVSLHLLSPCLECINVCDIVIEKKKKFQ